MKVIILKTGEVEEVSFGYAANYLIPQRLAVRATKDNLKKIEGKKLIIEEKKKEKESEEERLIRELEGKKIKIKLKAGKQKKAFGSVGKKQILNALKLSKNQAQVILEKPIKKLGKHKTVLKIGKKRASIEIEVIKE